MSHHDILTIAMQADALRIVELRLNRPLQDNLKEKNRLNR
jgi:hypothetical protein